jgi:dihydrofolate reductase
MVTFQISVSLDGFVAGPNPTLEDPIGERGMELHEWVFGLASWRRQHGLEGGDEGPDSDLIDQLVAGNGAYVMGRRMFSNGEGPWEDDPMANGWWGDTPPFGVPVFVVTHHPRETVSFANGTSFVFVDGVESAVEQAKAAAGDRDVAFSGGADVIQQALRAGLVDEFMLHVVPVLFGSGTRLFEGVDTKIELVETIPSAAVTHLRYRVA